MVMDERVHVHGFVPESERETLMAGAHLLIAPSRYEGFGYPAAEAMIRGLPVFASDAGAFREFVPEDWRFPLDDPAVLASMIDSSLKGAYSKMEGTARKAISRFDPQNHLDSHRRIFGRLVSGALTVATPPLDGLEWRPSRLDRLRALGRRAVLSTLGDRVENWLQGLYHRVLRQAGRFGLPEDEATEALLAAVAARSQTILDVGANVGRYTWFLQRHASTRSVLFALEPHPAAARLLRSALGRSPRCTVLEVAAADHDETAELMVPNGPFGIPVSALAWVRSGYGGKDGSALQIKTRRIDSLVQDGTISVVDPVFMKIDVEGAEERVLRGAAALLSLHRPVIYLECQTPFLARQDGTPESVWSLLRDAGYRVFANSAGRFVPVEGIHPETVNYIAIPDLDAAAGNDPLDAVAMIEVIAKWAPHESEA